jgi:glycine betaine transporter
MNNNEVRNSPGDDHDAMICQKSVFTSPLLIAALIITAAIAIWGLVNTAELAAGAAFLAHMAFTSRAWFIIAAISFMLIASIWLALPRYGGIKLDQDDDQPEFSTFSWLTMLFAAGDLNPGIYHPVGNTN